jgi:hypothetical protein
MRNNGITRRAATNRAVADAQALQIWNDHVAGLPKDLSLAGLAAELNRRGVPGPRGGRWHKTSVARLANRVRSAGAITYYQAQLLKRAVEARIRELRRRSSGHPGLAALRRIAGVLPENPPEGSSVTTRFSPMMGREDLPFLGVAARAYLEGILRDAHDHFRRRYPGSEDRELEKVETRAVYEEALVLEAALAKLCPDHAFEAPRFPS